MTPIRAGYYSRKDEMDRKMQELFAALDSMTKSSGVVLSNLTSSYPVESMFDVVLIPAPEMKNLACREIWTRLGEEWPNYIGRKQYSGM